MLKNLFKNYWSVSILWFALAFATIVQNVIIATIIDAPRPYNNYKIFEGVFWHTIQQVSLYVEYPAEYFDRNHYGIFFSGVIAPFALLPSWLGASLWILANAGLLYWAIRQLPLSQTSIIGILLISAHDMYTAAAMQQFNISIIALLVLAFVFIEKGKSHWATLFIVIGILTKLYGVVGLAFFFFSKDKMRFVWSGLLWLLVLFCLPMLYSSPEFVISQYEEWFLRLSVKNNSNTDISNHYNLQNLSFLGFLQRIGLSLNNLYVLGVAVILFCLPYLRFKQYQHLNFRLMFLASVSIFICIFSTGTENSTYVIAYVGIGIWWVASPNKNNTFKIVLLVLAILASLSPTDLFKPIKEDYIIRYSLRAVPPTMIWLTIIYEMCIFDYKKLNYEKTN